MTKPPISILLSLIIAVLMISLFSCKQDKNPLDKISESESPKLMKYFQDTAASEIQIVYTQIDRDENNTPSFSCYTYNFDSLNYFYPASTIKMPVAFLALQKLNEIGIDIESVMQTDSSRIPQTPATIDTTHVSGLPSVAHYIEKLFVVSDNDAYNRLYEFLGQDYINQELKKRRIFSNSRIVTRVGIRGFSTDDNRYTNPISFLDDEGTVLYQQKEQVATGDYFSQLKKTHKGLGYYVDSLDIVKQEAFDMGKKNFINLKDLEASLMRVIFADNFNANSKFSLTDDDYNFLISTMQKLPKDFKYLVNQDYNYYDSYVKFFLVGDDKGTIPDHIKIFNKVGYAYGYLTDCAYIIDLKNKIEFFLTATIHVNSNKIYNDGQYEYDEGIAFLADLGRKIYNLEAQRDRKYPPNLDRFIVD